MMNWFRERRELRCPLRWARLLVLPAMAMLAVLPGCAAAAPPVEKSSGAVRLEPVNRTQFFLRPDVAETLKWRVPETGNPLQGEVRDYSGQVVTSATLKVVDGELQWPLRLAAGFYELKIGPDGPSFGIIVAPPFAGKPDPFFGIDAALSWLELRPAVRTDLITLLERSGIGTARERLSWGAVNPRPDEWNWETDRHFDSIRQEYTRHGMRIVELFHGAPGWAGPTADNPYPSRLGETMKSWQTMGERWQPAWGALEVWNEPDIDRGGELPADQYLPLIKAVNWGLAAHKLPTLVGGGVFGYFNPGYVQGAVRNGLLDQVDFVSFHTYAKAPAMERLVADYRGALAVPGAPAVPLWITEAGWPWSSGTARPGRTEDAASAQDIAMKGIEAKACGIARYFAFDYVHYVEGGRNFGMMGQEVTPLRSMAAYVQAVAALSGATYLGDLNLGSAAVQRARVFARGENAVIVLYGAAVEPAPGVTIPVAETRIQGIDGRELSRTAAGQIPLADGLTYVFAPLKSITSAGTLLRRDTVAAHLTSLAGGPAHDVRISRPPAAAVVLQPVMDPAAVKATKRGYTVASAALAAFPLRVKVQNLSDEAREVSLHYSVDGSAAGVPKTVKLAAMGSQEVGWTVDISGPLHRRGSETVGLDVDGREAGGLALSPLSLEVSCERELAEYMRFYPASTRLDIGDTKRWQPKIGPHARMTMKNIEAGTWQLSANFDAGERWVYPEFKPDEGLQFAGSAGLLLRVRALSPATVRLMVKERGGATYFTPFSIIAADGQWHSQLIRWQDLAALPSAPPDENGALDLDQIASLSVGMNPKGAENILEVSDLLLARSATP